MSDLTPTIHSFIIRFIVEDASLPERAQPVYRGAVRHIQSAEELHFQEWQDAVEFIRRFVPIETLNDKSNPTT